MEVVSSLAPFEKTVAGSTPILFAQNFPGRIFKPAHPCEKEFYEGIDKHPQLRKLVPKYHGTLTYQPATSDNHESTQEHSHPSEYLVMEDLTYGFSNPCILDVKLGTTHHDIDFNNPLKPPRQSKYITAPALGFCLTGMQVYKQTPTNRYEFMDKAEGRSLTQTTIVDKLTYFFHNGTTVRRDVISKLIQRLLQVATYFENKPAFTFRSSSLLLLYEGRANGENADRVEVKMIDFAHAKRLPVGDNVKFKDEYGYLYGTRNLVRILESIKAHSDSDLLLTTLPSPTSPNSCTNISDPNSSPSSNSNPTSNPSSSPSSNSSSNSIPSSNLSSNPGLGSNPSSNPSSSPISGPNSSPNSSPSLSASADYSHAVDDPTIAV